MGICKFNDVAIKHNNMVLYKSTDAIKVVKECFRMNKSVYGIDAFILKEQYIQPFMEHSINADEMLNGEEQQEIFIKHLKKYLNSEFVFEIVYEGY
ncbi:MAG: hypothetical protein FWH04_00095 [Oscillospiraceae bacterium]|nr:hypothetical protein [Oscillospiraceae bacterium]